MNHLQFPLTSWSGRIQRLLQEARDAKIYRLNVTEVPGGAEAFDLELDFDFLCLLLPVFVEFCF